MLLPEYKFALHIGLLFRYNLTIYVFLTSIIFDWSGDRWLPIESILQLSTLVQTSFASVLRVLVWQLSEVVEFALNAIIDGVFPEVIVQAVQLND